MNSYEFEQVFKSKSRMIKILWFALTLPVLIYTILIYFLSDKLFVSQISQLDEHFKYFFYAAGIGVFFVSLLIRKFFLSDSMLLTQLRKDVKPEEAAYNPKTKKIDQDELLRIKTLSGRELKLIVLINWYMKPFLIQMAVNESITILGLVLSILTQKEENILPFAAASLFLCIVSYLDINKIMASANRLLDDPAFYQYY